MTRPRCYSGEVEGRTIGPRHEILYFDAGGNLNALRVQRLEDQLHRSWRARSTRPTTPRWTAYDAKRFGVTMDDDVPMITQERAFTSPIWYTP